jgi:hypothetical protein
MLYRNLRQTSSSRKLLVPNLEYDHEAADVGAEGGAKNGKVHGLVAPSRVFIFFQYASICERRLLRTDAFSRSNKNKILQRKFRQKAGSLKMNTTLET